MIPLFLRFYQGYTMQSLLNEYAITFFAMCNEMFKLHATELLDQVAVNNPPDEMINSLAQRAEGNAKIIEQARLLRKVRNE